MDYRALFAAIDAKPFVPFKVELASGRIVDVKHPENIMILPNRSQVRLIQVYQTEPFDLAIIWPGGLQGLFYPTSDAPAA